jgi:hypothetical protein
VEWVTYVPRPQHLGAFPAIPKEPEKSEEKEEIAQLCRRIYEIEQELHRLTLIAAHLQDDQIFELPFDDLVGYGFEASLEAE